jgi:heterogeneous nuclear ribonucleoprotein U
MSKTFPPLPRLIGGEPTLTFLIGLPGCGKSTFLKKHLQNCVSRYHIASTDDILERFAQEDGTSYDAAWNTRFKEAETEFREGIMNAARENIDIIVDRTNVFPSARRKVMIWIESSTKESYRLVAIVFPTPEDSILQKRLLERAQATGKNVPWDSIEQMRENFIEPTHDEFHRVRGPTHP